MNDKLQTFINFFVRNNQLKNYLFFFMISVLLWFLSNLSQQYKHWVVLPIEYVNIPDGILRENLPKDTLQVEVLASGYQIMKLKMLSEKLHVDVKSENLITQKNWNTKDYFNQIGTLIGKENSILNIIPTQIEFKLNKIRKKKVKILADISIKYQLGYKNKENIKILPDSLWIFGLPSDLKQLNTIYTKPIELNNVSKDIEGNIALDLSNNVKSNIKNVSYRLRVDQFVEQQSKASFELINVSSRVNVVLFPKSATVKYKVFKSDYEKVKNYIPLIQLDYKQRDSVLYPKLVNVNNNIFDVSIYPKKVAFLIKNK